MQNEYVLNFDKFFFIIKPDISYLKTDTYRYSIIKKYVCLYVLTWPSLEPV